MTNDKQRVTIFKVALEAVQASMDAHGHAVAPDQAWDFMLGVLADSDRDEDLNELEVSNEGMSMPREFAADYKRLVLERKDGGRMVAPENRALVLIHNLATQLTKEMEANPRKNGRDYIRYQTIRECRDTCLRAALDAQRKLAKF